MKKTLKLIPAVVMLLISAILVSTSTYAWFTMNASVTATNMAIKASTSGSLLISKDDVSWTTAGTSIDYELDTSAEAVDVIPTSMNPGAAAATWYTTSGTDANNGAKPTSLNYTPLTTFTTTSSAQYQSDGKTYALHETFYIKSPSGAMSNLGVASVAFRKLGNQTGNNDIDKAVCARIEIKTVGGSDTVYTTWANSGSTSMTYVNSTTATATGYALKGTDVLVKNESDAVTHTINMAANISYQVDVYIYLDGENANCTSFKAYNWTGVTLDITFGTDISYSNETP